MSPPYLRTGCHSILFLSNSLGMFFKTDLLIQLRKCLNTAMILQNSVSRYIHDVSELISKVMLCGNMPFNGFTINVKSFA